MAKKKKGPKIKMTMTADDVAYRRRLVERWDFICLVCGHPFANLACVTKEHIRPKSMVPVGTTDNIAPSHHVCNKLRGTMSILEAQKVLAKKRKNFNSEKSWLHWLSAPVPNRIVPDEALQPLNNRPLRTKRILAAFELPEHLPGIPVVTC